MSSSLSTNPYDPWSSQCGIMQRKYNSSIHDHQNWHETGWYPVQRWISIWAYRRCIITCPSCCCVTIPTSLNVASTVTLPKPSRKSSSSQMIKSKNSSSCLNICCVAALWKASSSLKYWMTHFRDFGYTYGIIFENALTPSSRQAVRQFNAVWTSSDTPINTILLQLQKLSMSHSGKCCSTLTERASLSNWSASHEL